MGGIPLRQAMMKVNEEGVRKRERQEKREKEDREEKERKERKEKREKEEKERKERKRKRDGGATMDRHLGPLDVKAGLAFGKNPYRGRRQRCVIAESHRRRRR